MGEAETELKEKIDVLLRKIAERNTDALPEYDHGYTDALIWLQEGSIPLTREGIKKEQKERAYADKNENRIYYHGYNSALETVLNLL
jgi:hypothetical protein